MNLILDILSKHIEIKQCKNNKRAYISKECPFCGEKGKRVFRYNARLKVGKSYCCGLSFKEVYWLEQQLIDKDFARKFRLKNRHGLLKCVSDETYNQLLLEDKLSVDNSRFVKSKDGDDDNLDLPF